MANSAFSVRNVSLRIEGLRGLSQTYIVRLKSGRIFCGVRSPGLSVYEALAVDVNMDLVLTNSSVKIRVHD